MRLGIDVGGTNTDAVVLDSEDNVLAKKKTPTTSDVTGGIIKAMRRVLTEVKKGEIKHVMVGTTHCTNAIAEREGLAETAVIRIGAPATLSIRPLFEWPENLRQATGDHVQIFEGGHEFSGEEMNELDEEGIEDFLEDLKDEVETVSITSVFSPVNPEHEDRAEEIAESVLEDVPISLSNEIGSIGLLERENATALNAALVPVMDRTSRSILEALDDQNIDAEVYFCQNDGTLMALDYARKYPVLTLASGPSNSLKGAAYLSNMEKGIVIDVGGTTTDIGALSKGFPRESSTAIEIGGIKTNFRMPDLISIGIGGGSIVELEDGGIQVGPESVGKDLPEKGSCFGGNETTSTDAAVKLGMARLGKEKPGLSEAEAEKAIEFVEERLHKGVEKMKTEAGKVPVSLVGGGSILVRDIEGASQVSRPSHYEVANAIGAAISQVSGETDRIFSMEEKNREDAVEEAKERAKREAIEAGADPETLEIVNVEEVPLAYLPGEAVRIKAKATGDLALGDQKRRGDAGI